MMTDQGHWITAEQVKGFLIQRGHRVEAVNGYPAEYFDFIQRAVDWYGNRGADLGTALENAIADLVERIRAAKSSHHTAHGGSPQRTGNG